ncbi:hypothetical protein FNV43_RR13771 [Rhamnella rubrinervis]|uniref:Aminotransferase class I/classII large domain-containing protein n=1 Tax=Rhamnella rubrinervis TaxID=2594499 RepID=A0A8K0MFJ7_9ROSA|nr:hypothetical protein FNV43_RR13771 [Rhamnella rubrinervis]
MDGEMVAVSMTGGCGLNSYSRNSAYQRKVVENAKELMSKAIVEKLEISNCSSSNTFRVADLGCSVGPNTFLAVHNIVDAVERKYQSQGLQIPEFQVFFNDHASNDFNQLFTSLPPERRYYATGVPGSFRGRLFPSSSLHFVHSSSAVHWLSRVPNEVVDKASPAWNKGRIYYSNSTNEVVKSYEAQFFNDMLSFLSARAQEIVNGGFMALILPVRSNGTPHSQVFLNKATELVGCCLVDMVTRGMISEEKVDTFNIPWYIASVQQVETVVKRNGSFRIEIMKSFPAKQRHTIISKAGPITETNEAISEMENWLSTKWNFEGNGTESIINRASEISVRGFLFMIMDNLNKDDNRTVVPLGHGDPSVFPCFRTCDIAEDAVVDALRSAKYNCYAQQNGILPARRAVAEYLSCDLPYNLSEDDVFLTLGCGQAIDVILRVLARPGANILLPRPGFPLYEACAVCCNLEVRHYDLLPERGWEADLEAVEGLSDENTVAIVIINPGNPCGCVYTRQHLEKVAETARKLRILVIADEVYDHLAFGSTPFVPMGVFGSVVPVITLGAISKRWLVPGWRLGWLVTSDPSGILKISGLVKTIMNCVNVSPDPPTFIQGALPQILEKTKDDFFLKIVNTLREAAETCYNKIKEIPCITCPNKPEGSMFVMVKLNLSLLDDIGDDVEFCIKLAKEESVVVLPGTAVGLKNWLRITFAIEPSFLEDGIGRIKAFYIRHAKMH